MGTRHLIMVVANNQIKVSNYGQFDGYPSGQGVEVLNFLLSKRKQDFKQKVEQCSWITEEELQQCWINCGAEPKSQFVNMDVSDKFNEIYPHLHRECGSQILDYIQESAEPLKLKDSTKFAADSLFCEWAYVIDLDKNTFEVYEGFNKNPLTEEDRFFFLNKVSYEEHRGEDQYYPIKLRISYSLDKLPTKEEFLQEFEPREEDE